MFFSIHADGYDVFRTLIHQRCITGLLHGVMMPIASLGVAFLIRGLAFKAPRNEVAHAAAVWIFGIWGLLYSIAAVLPCCTLQMCVGCEEDTVLAVFISGGYYLFIIIGFALTTDAKGKPPHRLIDIRRGVAMLAISVCCMEFFGHWYLEGYSSDLSVIPNSIFHTPRYAVRSLLGMETCV